MKKKLAAVVACLGVWTATIHGAEAKSLEDILKEKGVITEADYKEVSRNKPLAYKIGKGFVFTSPDEKFQLNIGGLLMLRYSFADKDNGQDTSQFSLKKARVWFQGYAFEKDLNYRVQLAFENAGNEKMLEYVTISYRLMDELQFLAGQNKVVYGRQNMAAVGNLQLVDVSPVTTAFIPGYDLGAYVNGRLAGGIVQYDMSVSNGAGQTKTRTMRPNNSAFLARLQVNPFGAVGWAEGDPGITQKPLATVGTSYYRNGVAMKDGSLEANNLGYAGKSGWLGQNAASFGATETKVDVDSINADAAFKWRGASAQAEYFWGQGDGQISGNTVRAHGYYFQAGYLVLPKLELAMRYSYLDPNRDKANDTQSEILGGMSFYFNNHALKLQADIGAIHTQKSNLKHADDMQYRIQAALVF